jgi:multiple sugar transport system permease protein
MLSVSLGGFMLFFLLPFVLSSAYAFVDSPIRPAFAGWSNFTGLFENQYFLRGLRNTAFFMGVSIPLNLALPLLAALAVNRVGAWRGAYTLVFLAPLVMPSAVTALFWEKLFSLNGPVNRLLEAMGGEQIDFFQSEYGMYVIILISLWKNLGYNMALYLSGLGNIPKSYYESYSVEGGGAARQFFGVTLVYLAPTAFLALIMTFVNSFKVFKEIYIITGEYPHESLYVLQHYMNNMFLSLNYPKLVSAIYLLTAVIVLFVGGVFTLEGRLSKNLTM